MKNIPRVFIDQDLYTGLHIQADKNITHYLKHVMRRNDCLCFSNGTEYSATLSEDGKNIIIGDATEHKDPSNDITLYFAPIKKLDDMLNMVTQMGVGYLQPVITDRTVTKNINWERMRKIIIEASEQSNRNSIPKLLEIKKFSDIDLTDMVFADERAAYGKESDQNARGAKKILIGPEGGFSDAEFTALDNAGAKSLNLGKTILRAEVAATVAISRITE